MSELKKTRVALLKQMNQYIIDIGDEDIYETWITNGVPDCPSEDDFEFIADTDDEWVYTCKLFGSLVSYE